LDIAIVTMLACYYLMDIDYPKQFVLPFSVFQYFVFDDKKVPKELTKKLDNFMTEFTNFKVARLAQ